ncbi:FtsH protease activity modulator HflK [Acidaminobacter sp.]|uniref:FtsH protease activity modulator HflK n=1 Tax=Acidaminobacter sp. TaxID=1872102 RepID=UPI00137EBCF8|nr:FtsH protease activity modulator HflK [Acidaminobacter sp.]MDK9711031.1 FtsH protease activity modulator HflK [Acidaminobacter sp.]MZQ98516.1 FtsH protease activity modulator HflK [Acidaminobacter sp.]
MTKRTPTFFALILVAAVIIWLGGTSFYTVDQTEYAILETFGKPDTNLVQPGLRFKLPYPIQNVRKLSRETFSLTFGYEESQEGPDGAVLQEKDAKMITGDENIILADLEVQWQIVDPIAFLYNTEDPVKILMNATSSALRGVIGSSVVDDALTDGRTRIMNDTRDTLVSLVETYQIGVAIRNVNLQDVDLPNEQVSDAFKKVASAREERITKINQANRYRNEKINTAEGQKAALISRAEGDKVARIEQARGDVAQFNAIYSEYVTNKTITRDRLIIETLEQILPDVQIYIMQEGGGNTVNYLPLDQLKKGGEANE